MNITEFRFPCVRCGWIRYLHSATMLCVTVPNMAPASAALGDLVTCHEWSMHYWAELNDEEAA